MNKPFVRASVAIVLLLGAAFIDVTDAGKENAPGQQKKNSPKPGNAPKPSPSPSSKPVNPFAKLPRDRYVMSAATCALTCPADTTKPLCALFEDAAYAAVADAAGDAPPACSTLVSESRSTQFAVVGGRFTAQHGVDALLSTIWPLEAGDEDVGVQAVAPDRRGSWGIKLANGTTLDGPAYFANALGTGCLKSKFGGVAAGPFYLLAYDGAGLEDNTLRLVNAKRQPVWRSGTCGGGGSGKDD
ncbi:hypothetical protein HYH02_011623 [Chlamydomonas schloesseri]|uniref:Pherophorin domain-containing protein n=1 Tax=Chlamydomonas schloesseri TaxID=2026947 RepID=A0A835T4V9_9CHLO|nr:hypothetical protein HYH02_011623 [Chlamydomonas schloesseri]|eukprot:KAG2436113.1 hypothetical protein HYH02_011623 [Chlamydomonas schloesseri]